MVPSVHLAELLRHGARADAVPLPALPLGARVRRAATFATALAAGVVALGRRR